MSISAYLDEPALSAGSRSSARRKLRLEVQGVQHGVGIAVLLHDISTSGLLIESEASLAIGEPIDIELPHAGPVAAKVIWTNGRLFGCRFDAPISQAALSAAELRSAVGTDLGAGLGNDAYPSPEALQFGLRLRHLRVVKGLSQSDVAQQLGVRTPSVSGWETGRARPKPDRLAALAEVLGVSLAELEGAPSPAKLHDVLDRCRKEIAAAAGVGIDLVRIRIDL